MDSAANPPNELLAWLTQVSETLGIDATVEIGPVLDVARDVAHSVSRPATPLTTFLMGWAIGQGAAPADVYRKVRELAQTPPG